MAIAMQLKMGKSQYLQITIRVSQFEFNRFKKLKDDHKLSAREVLELSSCTCDKCIGTDIVAFDKTTGEPFKVPRNILSLRKS